MHDDEGIHKVIRELVEGSRSVWRTDYDASLYETSQLVADVLGLDPEHVRRHKRSGMAPPCSKFSFSFAIPNDLAIGDRRSGYGPPYFLTISRNLRSPADQQWTLQLEGCRTDGPAPTGAAIYRQPVAPLRFPDGNIDVAPVAAWFAEELSVDLVARACVGVEPDQTIVGPDWILKMADGQLKRDPMEIFSYRFIDLAKNVQALREIIEADRGGRS